MKLIAKLLLFGLALAAINAATYLLLRHNFAAGLYANNSLESVLAASFTMTKHIGLWAAAICALTSFDWFYTFASARTSSRRLVIGLFFLGYLWLAWLFFTWSIVWLRPDHYLLSALCLFAVVVPVVIGCGDIRRLSANNSFKPKPLRGSA
jgi:hypothetical protein